MLNIVYNKAVKKYGNNAVAMSKTISEESFINDWANMNGDIEAVLIMTHGKNQSISMDNGKQITSTGDGKTNIYNDEAFNVQDLGVPAGNISNATLFMYSCHSADDNFRTGLCRGTYYRQVLQYCLWRLRANTDLFHESYGSG